MLARQGMGSGAQGCAPCKGLMEGMRKAGLLARRDGLFLI
jgi:hypothetical protein